MTHRLNAARLRVLVLTALAALAIAAFAVAGADAKKVKVAGTTEVTPSTALTNALTDNGVTLAPIAPATAADGKLTFPIKRGRVNPDNLRGFLVHSGGVSLTKGERSVALRHFRVNSTRRGAVLTVSVRGAGLCKKAAKGKRHGKARHARRCHGRHQLRLAHLRNVKKTSASDGTVTVTADLRLTKRAAKVVNRRLGAKVAKAGALLGSAKVTATAAP